MLCATLVTASAAAATTSDPIALLALLGDPAGRSTAAAGGAVLTIVPARGRDLAVYGVVRTTAVPDRLVAWTRAIEQLYQGRDLELTTDFRDVFAEVASRHLGASNLERVFPDHAIDQARFRGIM